MAIQEDDFHGDYLYIIHYFMTVIPSDSQSFTSSSVPLPEANVLGKNTLSRRSIILNNHPYTTTIDEVKIYRFEPDHRYSSMKIINKNPRISDMIFFENKIFVRTGKYIYNFDDRVGEVSLILKMDRDSMFPLIAVLKFVRGDLLCSAMLTSRDKHSRLFDS